jgi:hypothetical protein
MRRWLKIVIPMGIAAVLVAVLAIGFGSPRGEAACGSNMSGKGRVAVGEATSYSMTFCSDPTDGFFTWVSWNRIDSAKNLALRVTDPSGNVYFVDRHPTAIEFFVASAPLAEGDWQVEVVNLGSRSVNYDFAMGFN